MENNLGRSGKRRFWEKHMALWNKTEPSRDYCRLNKISLKSFRYRKKNQNATMLRRLLSKCRSANRCKSYQTCRSFAL